VTAPIKILMTADAVGGVWQYSLDLAKGLSGKGVETVLAVMGPSPAPAQLEAAAAIEGLRLLDTGLPLDWLASDKTSIRSAGEAVARLAERYEADIVQLNAPALAAETRFPAPVVAVAHSCVATWWSAVKGTPIEADFRWRADLHGEGLRNADCAVAPSAAFAEATRAAYDLPAPPVTVHNGRAPLPLPDVAPHDFAFTAGRLWDSGKNLATLDHAAAGIPIPLYAAGPERGPNGDAIVLQHARALGTVSEEELARRLAARPIFVSAAYYEPFGLAVLEAAAAGCPLVLSDIPTFRELWGDAARFVPARDQRGFAEAVSEIAGDALLRARMGEAAKARAARYTVDAMASKMLQIYRALAAAPATEKAARAAA
jgi:glycosyltransferase involved in cell wall biosynthesis